MSAAERNRGARCEVHVVNYLRSVGFPDARRYLAGDDLKTFIAKDEKSSKEVFDREGWTVK